MWEYLFESSVWSIGGLVVGYVLGRADRNIRIIKRKVEEHDDS
jgi:hypothetical protein